LNQARPACPSLSPGLGRSVEPYELATPAVPEI
jgi:hypothetical protein